MNDVFNKARSFIYRNARPLDLALWRFHFEGVSKNEVLDILSFYQNADGGFGNAIEPDFWNVNSNPIATWKAIGVLMEIGIDGKEDIVKKILKYLGGGKDFENGLWYNTVKSNNDYPHAVWWECQDKTGTPSVNPTVGLAGFALKYADKQCALYKNAASIVKTLGEDFIASPVCDMHVTPLYANLYGYCKSIEKFDLFDLNKFKSALYEAVRNTVCLNTDKWFKEYVCKPSTFYDQTKLVFDILDRRLCEKEGDLMLNSQLDDGSYDIPWIWHNDYKEYFVAANWWKSSVLCTNMLYLKDLNLI